MKKFVWLVTAVVIGLCSQVQAGVAGPINAQAYREPIRVACVGDSITAGVGASKGNSYPQQLAKMLGTKWTVKNFGVSGSTLLNHGDLPYQKTKAFKEALAYNPDVVVIKLGTNDTKPQNWKFKGEFVADYENLIGQFTKLASKPRIYICHPAYVPKQGNFGINEAGVLEEIPMLDKLAADKNAGLIDIHGALKEHPEMLPDRVHPNTEGATVMAKTVYKALTGREFSGQLVLEPTPGKKSK